MGKIISIDLGTTNSVVAIIENGEPKVLTNSEGSKTTPSVVGFSKNKKSNAGDEEQILVGQIAKRQAINNSENTIFSSKRFIGRLFSEVQKEIKNYPFKVIKKKENESCAFEINGKEVSPEKIAFLIISKLKKDAENYLGYKVKEAIITVPSYFNDSQRQATKDAGKVAGLDVKRIINEPTAAALAYGLDKKEDLKVVVYDLGGGTFDISILDINNKLIEVKATNGNTKLGGDDFDEVILNWLIDEFKKEEGIDLKKDRNALHRLREASEKAKIELSVAQESSISLPFITANESGAKHLETTLTRAKFNQMTEHLVQKTLEPCKIVLKDADIKVDDIDEVIMVGGSTRIPAIQEAVKKFFKKELNQSVNPDEVVAMGAAVQAGVLSNEIKDVLLLDVTPLSLGIETLGGVMTPLISKNTTIPIKKSQVFSTAEDNQSIVTINVLQGERSMAKDNKHLGKFDLSDIVPAPRGVPQIEVSFQIDSSGIIDVSAKDKKTGKSQKIVINKPTLSQKEIDDMIKSSQVYEEQDLQRKKLIEIKNKLDNLIYQHEKLVKENTDKISSELKAESEESINKIKEELKKKSSEISIDDLEKYEETVTNSIHKLSKEIYKKSDKDSDGHKKEDKKADDSGKEETINVKDYDKKED
ncbi:MAG: molecular chaperone DnaK [Bdellovibrionales bacterium]|nr:molecular chaperone DnaK [Bdellovibrionales bacterium]